MTTLYPVALLALVEAYVLRRLGFGALVIVTVLAGTLLDLNYRSYTSVVARNYDGREHLFYIDFISQHLRLPAVNACTACGHPPLYYALGALWCKVALARGWLPQEVGLQLLSLLLFFGFVVFALLTARNYTNRPAALRLTALLIVFWPSSIINSVRVHNDSLASLLMMASIYYMSLWDLHARDCHFYAAVASIALALVTKSSGYAMLVALFMLLVLRLRSHQTRFDRRRAKQWGVAAVTLAWVALLASRGGSSSQPRSVCQRLLGRACDISSEHLVGNKLVNYLYFDIPSFLSRSDTAHPALASSDYFWNGLAKSSLFGVMPLGPDFDGEWYRGLALVISVLFLVMFGVCLAALPLVTANRLRRYRALACAAGGMIALLAAFRIVVPTPFHEDFRHIFPLLLPSCLSYAKAVEHLGRSSRLARWSGAAVGIAMAAASLLFFVRVH